ncbi:hypothetical protein [Roseovarius sp.]|uniref:hypothetical protein n=1 Tax=Roseovarius sp. TaxID=1486281 RepID=UPI002618A994|nr:hypothetical protein [Roseovarius sp.]MDM8167486.1 hypothetical protein [Roseovarius sp.]
MTMTNAASKDRVLLLLSAALSLGLAAPAPASPKPESTTRSPPASARITAPAVTVQPDGRPRKPSQRYVVYNRPYLKVVTDRALRNAIRLNQAGGEVVADGFSQEMSVHLFRMLLLLRQRTVNLLDSLENKRTPQARLTNLGYEAEIVGRTLATLKGEAVPAGATVLYRLEDETEDKATAIKRLTAYEALLYRWMNTPMEGTRRTPGAPDN